MAKAPNPQDILQPSPPLLPNKGHNKKWLFLALGVVLTFLLICIVVVGVVRFSFYSMEHPMGMGTQLLAFGSKGSGPGMLDRPFYIGLDQEGNIYVGDPYDGRINVFDPTGKYRHQISIGSDIQIHTMAVAPDGTMYLSYNGKIHCFDAQGNESAIGYSVLGYKDQPVEFIGIVLGPDNILYALDKEGEIFKFQLRATGSPTKFQDINVDFLNELAGLAVDGSGNIYAVGDSASIVMEYNPSGNMVSKFGGADSTDLVHPSNYVYKKGFFAEPDAIAVDGYGRIFVSDVFGVNVFDSKGQFIDTIFLPESNTPHGIVFDQANNLYVVTEEAVIYKFAVKPPESKP